MESFAQAAAWTGDREPIRRHFREALERWGEEALRAAVERFARPGLKPWVLCDALARRKALEAAPPRYHVPAPEPSAEERAAQERAWQDVRAVVRAHFGRGP